MMIFLQLYWSFVKIGFTSFGGLSMIPLISSEMMAHGWMTMQDVSDIVAIAEMTPGPVGLNCATYAGIRAAGIPGAVIANLGVLTPTLTLCLLAAIFFEKFKKSPIMKKMLIGVRPACIGLLIGVMMVLSASNYTIESVVSVPYIVIGLADAVLLLKCKFTVPMVILFSAAAGIAVGVLC